MVATYLTARRLRRARRGRGVRGGRDRRAARGQGRRARDDDPRAAHPRRAGAARSRCARRATPSTSPRSPGSGSGGGHKRAAGFSSDETVEEIIEFVRGEFARCHRARLSRSGLILADKPAGPSSFQVIAAIRRRTGARTGHAGTLDPFASGLLRRPLRRGDAARAVARRPRQALLHRGRPLRPHLDRRPGGRGRREARAAQSRRSSRSGLPACAARSSCRFRPPRR